MNPEVKEKWLKELRSNKYKQGRHRLRLEDRFCCLGVLCDIHSKETGAEWIKSEILEEYLYLDGRVFLPTTVAKWANLTCCGKLPDGRYLDTENDSGKTFEEIANIIEEQL